MSSARASAVSAVGRAAYSASVASVASAALPFPAYRPSAFTRLLARIDALPLHGWWVFPALWVALAAWAQGVLWWSGRLPVGTLDLFTIEAVFYAPYGLAMFAITTRIALRSLNAFWPATGWPDSERAPWVYRFVTLPRGLDLLALAIGIPVGIGALSSAPDTFLGAEQSRGSLALAYLPALILGYTAFPLIVFQTVRQLRLVARIHREATAIDPFDREPVYAFSRLTVVAGLGYLFIGYYGLAVNGAFQAGNLVSLATLAANFGVAMAAFILPLWGIHDRLVREKAELVRGVESRLGHLGDEMYRRVDAAQFDGTKAVSDSIVGVSMLRERIAKLPTWPWPPNVLRGFVTALLLPVIVYVASRLIGGNFGV